MQNTIKYSVPFVQNESSQFQARLSIILTIATECSSLVLSLAFVRIFFSPVSLQSLKDLGRLTYRQFLELFRHMVGLLGRVMSPSQGLYLHRTTQHRKTRTNIHALSGIRTHDPSNQPAKTLASDRTAAVTCLSTFALLKTPQIGPLHCHIPSYP
jgi:hypothetical protein